MIPMTFKYEKNDSKNSATIKQNKTWEKTR